ncbi:MAG: aminotransferase class V-fold PLP-dependent enzyme [Thermocladium sp.]
MKYLTPGPVQLPIDVLKAISAQPMFHRTDEFRELFKTVTGKLLEVSNAKNVAVIPGTGTTAVDAMVYSFLDPGDKVLALITGEFSERLAESAETRGAHVMKIEGPLGGVPDLNNIREVIEEEKPKAILAVHNETSTGVANRLLNEVADLAHKNNAMILIDSVSGMPAEPIDASRFDVVATASHKALMAPPGAAIVFFNDAKMGSAPRPPAIDVAKFVKSMGKLETPYTPPIPIMYALNVSLDIILDMGLEKYVGIHMEKMNYLYNELIGIGFREVPQPFFRSNTVAALYSPIEPQIIIKKLRETGYTISGGMWKIRDKSIRIGIMGDVALSDLKIVADALRKIIQQNK